MSHASSISSSNTPAENETLRRALRDYEVKFSRLKAAKDEAHLEVQRLQQHIVGLRHATQVQAFGKLEKDLKRTKAQAEETKRRLSEHDAELLRTKAALKERDTHIQHMKDEYNKLFAALQKVKTAQPASSSATASVASTLSPSRLSRLASASALAGKMLKPAASTPSLLAGAGSVGSAIHAGVDTASSSGSSTAVGVNLAAAGGAGVHDAVRAQANDHPYLIEHYKARIETLEKEIEGLKVQIRKMIASEYRYKQKNRLFRAEKSQLVDTCDRLRLELDKSVLSSARTITNTQKQLATSYRRSSSDLALGSARGGIGSNGRRESTSQSSAGGAAAAVNEVKKLRMRNQFLEERFRTIVASANDSKSAPSGSSSGAPRPVSAAPSTHTKPPRPAQPLRDPSDSDNDDDDGDESEADERLLRASHAALTQQLQRQSSGISSTTAIESSSVLGRAPAPAASVSTSFRSLDVDTLQALQQVKTKARVRPQSASHSLR